MPSDPRLAPVLALLRPRREAFRAALAATAEQVRAFLREQAAASRNGRASRLAAEFGAFGAGRIDTSRLSTVFHAGTALDAAAAAAVERALVTMTALAAGEGEGEFLDVPSGGDLRAATGQELARLGRAFSAVRTFELARAGGRQLDDVADTRTGFPYARWSRGERRLAPPLAILVDGADLRAESLAEFLDGAQKIVLVVRGRGAPAPLARLITPGTFVVQATDSTGLDRLVSFDGPGIAALLPDTAARFTHDPSAGQQSWDRLALAFVPEQVPRLAVGGVSAAQQAEALRLLRALATPPAAAVTSLPPSGPVAAAPTADPADKLAAWLLAQADLSDVG